MANKDKQKEPLSQPVLAMMLMGIAGSVLAGLSFQTIIYWPLPVSIAPYFAENLFGSGMAWGVVVGALVGLIIGYLTDEQYFSDTQY